MKKIAMLTVLLLSINVLMGMLDWELPVQQQLKQMEAELDQSVYVKDEVVEVRLRISESDFQEMLDHPTEEAYHEASVNYNGHAFDYVGIRTKGNSSLSSVARMDSDRYSFKLNLDYYVDGQTLFGQTVINLNNNFSDATMMREVLTYELLAEMGVPTPKFSYVNLYINDELWGLYLAIEEVDDAFLLRYFGDASGDLYKPEGTGSDLVWIDDKMSSYSGMGLRTNKNSADEGAFLSMLQELNMGTEYEGVIDVDGFLRYLAVSTAVVNLDSYQGSMKHNYYLYGLDGYFTFLPWDFNMSFGGFGGGMGGGNRGVQPDQPEQAVQGEQQGQIGQAGPGAQAGQEAQAGEEPQVSPGEQANQAGRRGGALGMGMAMGMGMGGSGSVDLKIDEPTQGNLSERPLIEKLLAVDEYKETYHQYLEEIVNGYLSEERFTARVAELEALISEYVKADPTKFYTFAEFQQGIHDETSGLLAFTAARVENVKQQLSGELSSVKEGNESTSTQTGDFFGGQQGRRDQQAGGERPADAVAGGFQGQGGNQNQPGVPGEEGEWPAGIEENQRAMFPGGEIPANFENGMRGGPGQMGGNPFGESRTDQTQARIPVSGTTLLLIGGLGLSLLLVIFFKPSWRPI